MRISLSRSLSHNTGLMMRRLMGEIGRNGRSISKKTLGFVDVLVRPNSEPMTQPVIRQSRDISLFLPREISEKILLRYLLTVARIFRII
jgi:hypothetical protein